MRKLVLYLITVLLLLLAVFLVLKGVSIGPITIYSFSEITEANNQLDKLISEAVQQKEVKYTEALNQQQQAYKTLTAEKTSYQQLLDLGVDENGIPLSKIQEYEIEKIWITLGNYAEKQGVDLKMDVTVNNSVAKTYDLNFTVVGEYIQIADFLYNIQRDNSLVFKIENFKLISSEQIEETTTETTDEGQQITNSQVTSYDLVATFVCKDIRLNIIEPVTEETTDDTTSGDATGTEQTTEATNQTTESTQN